MNFAGKQAVLAAVLTILFVHSGCDEGDAQQQGGPCAQGLELCDIRQLSCQQSTFDYVQCIRGSDDAVLPPVTTMTRDEYLDGTSQGDEEQDEDRASSAERFAVALRAFGYSRVVEPDDYVEEADREVGSQVSAFYSIDDDEIVVIADEGQVLNTRRHVTVLAHEMVHALQDQEGALESLYEGIADADHRLARLAVIEGEAELMESFADVSLQDIAPTAVDWNGYHGRFQTAALATVLESTVPHSIARLVFPYPWGSELMINSYFTPEGYANVRERRDTPPEATWQFLARRFDEVAMDEAASERFPGSVSVPELPNGYEQDSAQTFGAWQLLAYLAYRDEADGDVDLDGAEMNRVAAALRADAFMVFTDETPQGIAAWWLRFADSDFANRFRDALSLIGPPSSADLFAAGSDRNVVLVVSDDVVDSAWQSWALELANQVSVGSKLNSRRIGFDTLPPIRRLH